MEGISKQAWQDIKTHIEKEYNFYLYDQIRDYEFSYLTSTPGERFYTVCICTKLEAEPVYRIYTAYLTCNSELTQEHFNSLAVDMSDALGLVAIINNLIKLAYTFSKK